MSNRPILIAIALGVFLVAALLANWQFQPFKTIPVDSVGTYVRCFTQQVCFAPRAGLGEMCFPLREEDPQHVMYMALCRN